MEPVIYGKATYARWKERKMEEVRRGGREVEVDTVCPNVRLDDLSTYEKIAFYKLVSRKELEGIADEGGRRRRGGGSGKAKGCRKERGREDQDEKGRGTLLLILGRSSLKRASNDAKSPPVPPPSPIFLSFPYSSSCPPTSYKERHKLPRNLVSSDIKDFPITLALLRD